MPTLNKPINKCILVTLNKVFTITSLYRLHLSMLDLMNVDWSTLQILPPLHFTGEQNGAWTCCCFSGREEQTYTSPAVWSAAQILQSMTLIYRENGWKSAFLNCSRGTSVSWVDRSAQNRWNRTNKSDRAIDSSEHEYVKHSFFCFCLFNKQNKKKTHFACF